MPPSPPSLASCVPPPPTQPHKPHPQGSHSPFYAALSLSSALEQLWRGAPSTNLCLWTSAARFRHSDWVRGKKGELDGVQRKMERSEAPGSTCRLTFPATFPTATVLPTSLGCSQLFVKTFPRLLRNLPPLPCLGALDTSGISVLLSTPKCKRLSHTTSLQNSFLALGPSRLADWLAGRQGLRSALPVCFLPAL